MYIKRRLAVTTIAAAMLLSGSGAYASGEAQTSSAAKGDETSTTQSGEKSRSERETQTDTDERGGGDSTKKDSGSRSSVRREISRTLDRMKNVGINRNLNVVGIFAKAAKEAGAIRELYIDDLLKTPIGTHLTYRSNLQSIAGNNEVVDRYVKLDVVKGYITELYQAGHWISDSLSKARLAQGIGKADWEDVARLAAAYHGKTAINSIAARPTLDGSCRFVGQYTKIKCGGCVLDVGYAKGLPELTCNGLGMFGPDTAGGEQVVVQASESVSLKDAESQAQSDETFSGITRTLDEYTKWASSKGKAVEAAAVKRQVTSHAVKNSKTVNAALQAAKQQEDPMRVLGILGFK